MSELGITIRGTGTAPYANAGTGQLETNVCDYDAPITNSSGYHYLCSSPNAQGGGLIAYGASGSATLEPFYINVDGSIYTFPATTSGTVLTTTGSGSGLTGLTYTQLPALPSNNLLGSLTNATPSGQAVPSCSGPKNALIWTSGVGFGCNTITGSGLGSVTSVGLSAGTTGLTITGSPVTSAGTITLGGNLSNSALAVNGANTVLGSLTSSSPSALAVPSCSNSGNALTWSNGIGFGCSTVGTGTVNIGYIGNLAGYQTNGATVGGLPGLNYSGGTLTHGIPGSLVGSDIYANFTSGTITVAPPTGALGSVTETLPDNNATILDSVTGAAIGGSSSQTFNVATPVSANNAVPLNYFTPINNTSASSDLALSVGQSAYINVTAATSVPLHIATGDNQLYELTMQLSMPTSATVQNTSLSPNNTGYSSAIFYQMLAASGGATNAAYAINSNFELSDVAFGFAKYTISTKIISKIILGNMQYYNGIRSMQSTWNDTTTAWTSLGTINFPFSATGQIVVKRVQ
ncbi:MAG TPA: hypothetical protein PLO16_12635 [Acidocella sp.]|nr:hypothetical protein [Acidocella sp.]